MEYPKKYFRCTVLSVICTFITLPVFAESFIETDLICRPNTNNLNVRVEVDMWISRNLSGCSTGSAVISYAWDPVPNTNFYFVNGTIVGNITRYDAVSISGLRVGECIPGCACLPELYEGIANNIPNPVSVIARLNDGSNYDGTCSPDPFPMSNFCGDGIPDPLEACDDGNVVNGDGCNAICTSNETCGTGFIDPGEQCDDGNNIDGDGCSSTCQIECDAILISRDKILPETGALSNCPPRNILGFPDFSACLEETDINGDTWDDCLISRNADDAGNNVELWCETIDVDEFGRIAYWYNYIYNPAGESPKAIGKCQYPWGKNVPEIIMSACPDSKTIVSTTWKNVFDADEDETVRPRPDGNHEWDEYKFHPGSDYTVIQKKKSPILLKEGTPAGSPKVRDPWPTFDTLPPIVLPETLVDGTMGAYQRESCDLDDDGDCNEMDLALFDSLLNVCLGDAFFLTLADVDLDGCITDTDRMILSSLFAQNAPPVANAGPDQTVECTSTAGATVTLDGTASSDSDDDNLTYHVDQFFWHRQWTNSHRQPAIGYCHHQFGSR